MIRPSNNGPAPDADGSSSPGPDSPVGSGSLEPDEPWAERRSAERRQLLLLRHAADGYLLLDGNGTIIDARLGSGGHRAVAALEGRDVLDTVMPEHRGLAGQLVQESLAAPGEVITGELRSSGLDPLGVWVEVTLVNLLAHPDVKAVVLNYRRIEDRKRAEERLRFQAMLLDAVGQAVIATDRSGHITYWNRAATDVYGWTADEAVGQHILEFITVLDRPGVTRVMDYLTSGSSWHGEFIGRRKDGTTVPLYCDNTPVLDEAGAVVAVIGVTTDITERKAAEAERRQLSAIVESSGNAIIGASVDGDVLTWNSAATELFGFTAAEARGRPLTILVPADRAGELRGLLAAAADERQIGHLETACSGAGGAGRVASLTISPVEGKDRTVAGVSVIGHDVTARVQAEAALEHEASHDALTQLPNRAELNRRLTADPAMGSAGYTVMFLDVDHFKVINDSMGHSAGDELLVQLAERLRAGAPPGSIVARFGGDEFVLAWPGRDVVRAKHLAEALVASVRAPFVIEGSEAFVSLSAGIATAGAGRPAHLALRDADAAMYRAKERGRACIEVFGAELRQRVTRRLEDETRLRRALDRQEMSLAYQPVIEFASGRVVGFEALLRWQTPEGRPRSPAGFLPLAEETGLIVPIGEWVLSEALAQLGQWRNEVARGADLHMAVNVSGRQLAEPDLAAVVSAAVRAAGVPPEAVHLEMTESILMDDAGASLKALQRLKSLGVAIDIDDFGTGYSSLSYLKRFPVDNVKIDRSFVDGLGTNAHDTSIVSAVIGLARALGLGTIAEGVESRLHHDRLRALGCDEGQGYYFSRPLEPDRVPAWLAARADLLLRRPEPRRTRSGKGSGRPVLDLHRP